MRSLSGTVASRGPTSWWEPESFFFAVPLFFPLESAGGGRLEAGYKKLFTARSPQAHADTPSQTQLFRPLRTHQEGLIHSPVPADMDMD